jgi:hypothetical protein
LSSQIAKRLLKMYRTVSSKGMMMAGVEVVPWNDISRRCGWDELKIRTFHAVVAEKHFYSSP